jgi:SAM-dependent methyltransferase
MGRSDNILLPWYNSLIKQTGETALLGFTDNRFFSGDLYDRQLNNWDINADWQLNKRYDTIISLRCPYFAKNPEDFISRCYEHLNNGGVLYLDWGLGDHWRFTEYKVGWVKNKDHEYAYGEDNFLWSGVWDDSFTENPQFKLFERRVKRFGYEDVKSAVFKEVPKILDLNFIKKYFEVEYNMLSLWDDLPQLYILLKGRKNSESSSDNTSL